MARAGRQRFAQHCNPACSQCVGPEQFGAGRQQPAMAAPIEPCLIAGKGDAIGVVAEIVFSAHGLEHHDHKPALPGWTTWAFEPGVIIPLILTAVWYTIGLTRTWRTAGRNHGIRNWEAGCFAGGWLALLVALVSPIHPLGQYLFSVHMTQHEILMLVAAPGFARAQRQPALPGGDLTVGPAELQKLFDSYALVQAQQLLAIPDEQYTKFLPRFMALQTARRQALQQHTRALNQLRKALNDPDEDVKEAAQDTIDQLQADVAQPPAQSQSQVQPAK